MQEVMQRNTRARRGVPEIPPDQRRPLRSLVPQDSSSLPLPTNGTTYDGL